MANFICILSHKKLKEKSMNKVHLSTRQISELMFKYYQILILKKYNIIYISNTQKYLGTNLTKYVQDVIWRTTAERSWRQSKNKVIFLVHG